MGVPPVVRVDGELVRLELPPPSQADVQQIIDQVLNEHQKQVFERTHEVDLAFGVPGLARFRANFYQQRGTLALCFRQVPMRVPSLGELNLPPVIAELSPESTLVIWS